MDALYIGRNSGILADLLWTGRQRLTGLYSGVFQSQNSGITLTHGSRSNVSEVLSLKRMSIMYSSVETDS